MALVSAALQRLPDKFRVPLALRFVEGMPYEEIAQVIGPDAVHRALAHLLRVEVAGGASCRRRCWDDDERMTTGLDGACPARGDLRRAAGRRTHPQPTRTQVREHAAGSAPPAGRSETHLAKPGRRALAACTGSSSPRSEVVRPPPWRAAPGPPAAARRAPVEAGHPHGGGGRWRRLAGVFVLVSGGSGAGGQYLPVPSSPPAAARRRTGEPSGRRHLGFEAFVHPSSPRAQARRPLREGDVLSPGDGLSFLLYNRSRQEARFLLFARGRRSGRCTGSTRPTWRRGPTPPRRC